MTNLNAHQVAKKLGESYSRFIKKLNAGEYSDLPRMRKSAGPKARYLFIETKVDKWIEDKCQGLRVRKERAL